MKATTVVVDPRKIKRIAITCKCGHRFIENVPGEVLDGGAMPMFECPAPGCGNHYIIRDGQLKRVPDLHQILDTVHDYQGDVATELDEQGTRTVDHNAWSMPQSKLVN